MDRYEVPPQRLVRWLDRWREREGPVTRTHVRPDAVTFEAARSALDCEPPFPPLVAGLGVSVGYSPGALLDHVERELVVGVVLVRLGGHAAGVFAGRRLVASKVGRRNVHGRHRAGGSSARRFERRREGQARVALEAAAGVAAGVLLGHRLDAVVLGGDRRALAGVLADERLRPLRPLVVERVLEVADPRLDVLRGTPDAFLATVLRPRAHVNGGR
jgi:Actinobacteria/chloroflexi VLRF1 release factor